MRILKILVSVGILFSLFLPLAHCGSHATETHGDEVVPEISIEKMHELDKEDSGDRILIFVKDMNDLSNWAIYTFLLPLFLCFLSATRKWQLAILVLQTLTVCWFIWMVYIINAWWPYTMWGGYLFFSFIAIYFSITIFEWIVFIKRKSKISTT